MENTGGEKAQQQPDKANDDGLEEGSGRRYRLLLLQRSSSSGSSSVRTEELEPPVSAAAGRAPLCRPDTSGDPRGGEPVTVSIQIKNSRRIPWQLSRLRNGTIRRRKRNTTTEEAIGRRRSTDGRLARRSTLEAPRSQDHEKAFASDAAAASRQEIDLITTSQSRKPRDGRRDYEPKHFHEIVGHEIVIRALSNAIQRRRVSPLYLFHGPGGTGKTSTAKIFAMALNCEADSSPSKRPCRSCSGCARSLYIADLCSGNRNSGFEKVRTLLQSTAFTRAVPGFKVFLIDECHSLAADSWQDLHNIVESGQGSMVFIMITEDAKMVPRAVSSRCQKFCFTKLKDTDVTLKLAKIASQEGIEIEQDALRLIAAKAEGNLREAENVMDQLALLGPRITSSMVQQLVGLVPDERLIHLLEAALTRDSIEALRCTRDLISSGIEPQALVSQLSVLVTNKLTSASSSPPTSTKDKKPMGSQSQPGKSQTERWCHALKILIETEKQLMLSPCNRTTWVTAALLQIALEDNPDSISTGIILPKDTIQSDDKSDTGSKRSSTDGILNRLDNLTHSSKNRSQHSINTVQEQTNVISDNLSTIIRSIDMEEVWQNILERIQSKYIEEFLRWNGKLVSLTVSKANAIVHLMFKHPEDKLAAEMSELSISNALKAALGCRVTVNISREPTQVEVVPRGSAADNEKQVADLSNPRHQNTPLIAVSKPSGSLDSSRLLLKRNVSQKFVPKSGSNLRSTRLQNTIQLFADGDEHIVSGHEDSTAQTQQLPAFSGHLTHGQSVSNFTDPEMDPTMKIQSLDTTSIARPTELKYRLLSLSAIPQSDMSIEPYSQDLLFEEANTDIQQGTINSKLHKGFSKEKQQNQSLTYMGLNRSWSCTERFCRGQTVARKK